MKVSYIIKGVFLYITLLSGVLTLVAAESLYYEGLFFFMILLTAFMGWLCKLTLTKEDIDILTGARWLKTNFLKIKTLKKEQ